jgi:hypothetical protein
MKTGVTEQFPCVLLDDIRQGEITLTVPVRDDIVQVDSVGKTFDGKLDVVRDDEGDITVRHHDATPLQVEIVTLAPNPWGHAVRTPVFETPIDELLLLHLGYEEEEAVWMAAGEGLVVPNVDRLITFVATLGIYGGIKQRQNALKERFKEQ